MRAPVRPDFMTWTFAAAFVLTSTTGLVTEMLFRKEAAADTLSARAEELVTAEHEKRGWKDLPRRAPVERLQRARGVELLAATRPFYLNLETGPVSGDALEPSQLDAAADLVAGELSRYPRSFLDAIHLRRVLFCATLRESGHAIPSLPNFERTLLLEVPSSSEFLRRLLHHEVFHFADFAEDEQVLRDPEWERLNDRYFIYGEGGRNMREGGASRFRDDLPGFVTAYSTSGLEEDKAEIFAFLMVAPSRVAQVMRRDAIVFGKVRRLVGTLARRFPDIDERFWARQR